MSITIQENLFYIHSKDTTMIIENRGGFLLLKHLGKRITSYHFSNSVGEKDHAFSGNPLPDDRAFSFDTQRQVLGLHGFGDFRKPAWIIQHDNNEFTQFRLIESKVITGNLDVEGLPTPHSLEASQTLVLVLEDDIAKLRLKIFYTSFDNHNTIATFSTLENVSDDEVIVHKALSSMLDLPSKSYDMITFQGAYGREKSIKRQTVGQGYYSISSNRGASGHSQTPSLILCDSTTNEESGEALALQLMYSGNFQAFVQENQLGEVRVGIGINDENFAWKLDSGEKFTTPIALLTYSDKGLTTLSQESQHFILDHVMPKQFAYKERPVLINNWEATYFDFNKKKLLQLADEAQAMGMELFVLDDGWFGNRFDDNRALGDWYVNEEKLGGGLADLISEIHARNLKFGIWVEPEMISEESDLFKEHPDWCIQVPGRAHTYSRNQLVLDLSNKEVVAFIKEFMYQLLSSYDIDYVKWDMNRNITNLGNGKTYIETKMQSHAYILGLYDIVNYLTSEFPAVLFESCSGGGGRNDLGMMRYFPQVWASDNTDAISRLHIQYGSSYLYPTISMEAHVSASPNHQMGRSTPLQTRGHVAMMGNLGYELDLTSLSEEEKLAIKDQVAHYKSIRKLVQFGKQTRLLNPDSSANEVALQFSDKNQVLVTYVRIHSTIEKIETTLKLKELEADAVYQLQGTSFEFSGAELMYAGLTMMLPQADFQSQQLHFVKK
ncbi:TPA: alpha-galactosidase [Streptococcus suis]|nr:alpha-galactosidase [Streptococcus suis]HEM5241487.1 alpha-galactosidase [Streptococcus suis]